MQRRVIIFYITNLSGHHKAATSLEKAFKILDKDCEVISLDILRYLHPVTSYILNKMYAFVIKKYPFVWANMYDKQEIYDRLEPVRRFIHKCDLEKIARLIRRVNPDAVVCTQAFPCGLISEMKEKKSSTVRLIGVITDFWANRYWFCPNADFYIIPTEWCRKGFEQAGISSDKVKKIGIPISPKFTESYPAKSISKEFDLDQGLPTVLIMGGGAGMGPLREAALSLDGSETKFQIVVVCGKNNKLYNWFRKKKFTKKIKVFSYIDQVYKLMELSDIVISKPGGITASEAMSKRLAFIVLSPLPGQEENNANFLLREGLALKADSPSGVTPLVEDLLNNKDKLEQLKNKGAAFSNPDAALDSARLIFEGK